MNNSTNTDYLAASSTRLASPIDYILCSDPNTVLLVAMLIQNNFHDNQIQTDAYNAQVPGLVGERYKKGYKIRTVDMSSIGGKELNDSLHPSAFGYQDMANTWYDAITQIPDAWWTDTKASGPAFGGPLETCERGAISFIPAIGGNVVAAGAHVDNDPGEPLSSSQSSGNIITPNWGDDGTIASGSGFPGSGVQFADLDGDGLPDYIWVNYTDGSIRGWINTPPRNWAALNSAGLIAFGLPGASFVEFADLNNDKRAEYIVIADGHFRVFRNDGVSGTIVLWTELVGAGQQLDSIFGGAAGFHYFADLNGDGLADLIVHNANGVLDIYFNTGPNGDGFGWTPCLNKGIATGRLWFVDIDGDGRADYMSMDDDGGVSGWLNKPGGTCDISWVAINGRGPKTVALGAAPVGKVRLVDMNKDGKADYLIIDDDIGTVRQFTNLGTNHAPDVAKLGGYAAGVRLADLNGDGRDDYLSITDYTGVLAYLNEGQSGDSSWTWQIQENGAVVALGYAGAKRYMIQFADLNGDGRDDYIVVDTTTGQVHTYLNLGSDATSNWLWDITQPIIAIAADGVHFADYDGDGRADYIVMDENGALRVWLNQGPGDTLTNWQPVNRGLQAAIGVGAQREDVRLVDIDGDGKFDYVWVHPDTGAIDVWYNILTDGVPGWLQGNQILSGQGYPGQNIIFGRIGTTGRGDYVALDEASGAFRVWINQCSKVLYTNTRQISGSCPAPPLPPQSTTESGPTPRPTIVSVDQDGHTVIQGADGVPVTLPTGIHTPITTTDGSGGVLTFSPPQPTGVITTTDSVGQTVISDSSGAVTLPFGITTAATTTATNGEAFTFVPASSSATSSAAVGVLIPYWGRVDNPTSDSGNSIFPCWIWFFNICISWVDIRIGGWYINLPTGIRPPGPPPPITFPPLPHFTVSIKGPLPDWPQISVDPNHTPHFPSNKPTDCTTQTAEICMTTTTFGISGTMTTDSATLSTCETIYGCKVTNTAITTAQTTGCTSLTTSSACVVGCTVMVTANDLNKLPTNCQTSTCTFTTSGCDLTSLTGSTTSRVVYGCASLTDLPTLSSVPVYCTQTQCDGKQLLVPKTDTTCATSTQTCTTTTSPASPAPTINTNQGILTCGTRNDPGDQTYWYSGGEVEAGKNAFCTNMTNNDPPVVFKPGTQVYKSGLYYAPDNQVDPIRFSAKWTVNDPGCPTTDMSASGGYALCQDRINTINNQCDVNTPGYFNKQGGKFFRDCITWEFTSNVNPVDL